MGDAAVWQGPRVNCDRRPVLKVSSMNGGHAAEGRLMAHSCMVGGGLVAGGRRLGLS